MPTYATPTRAEAARFLSHAALGWTSSDIESVKQIGYQEWLNRQFTAWQQTSHWDWMLARMDPKIADGNLSTSVWRRFIEGRDLLRQKVTFALSQIFVTSVKNFLAANTSLGGGAYLDMLESKAFGNFRDLLQGVSGSLLMSYYLSFKGSKKSDPATGQQPDENYARELLQLFTMGLFQLDEYGNAVTDSQTGEKIQTYNQSDVEALARVFTGWDSDLTDEPANYQRWKRPMVNSAHNTDPTRNYFDAGAKNFSFMPPIAAGLSPEENLSKALDGIFNHPNVGPFIGKQLIQKLVTSNPSAAYVGRVTAAFNNNGQGVRGDMKAVIRAILLDPDLFDADRRTGKGPDPENFGKLREPVARLVLWAKAFNVRSRSGNWDSPTHSVWQYFAGIGQEPMKSNSVFNFYRPDYMPPGTDFADRKLLAPEFQITTESSVIAYVQAMQTNIGFSLANASVDTAGDYSAWFSKASDPAAMVEEMNVLLAAGQLSADTKSLIVGALNSMPLTELPSTNPNDPIKPPTYAREQRVKAAVLMIVSAPEFLVQK